MKFRGKARNNVQSREVRERVGLHESHSTRNRQPTRSLMLAAPGGADIDEAYRFHE
jgi:hypothetical protein